MLGRDEMAWALALDPSSCSGVIIIGIGIYTLTILCENLLCSTGNSPQCSVLNWMERNSKKEGIYVYVQLIHCHTVETNTILHSNYTTIKTYSEKKSSTLPERLLRSFVGQHMIAPAHRKAFSSCFLHGSWSSLTGI